MKTHDELRNICDRNGRVSERVVDHFLLSYAAGHRGLEKKMELQFARFRHVGKQLGKQAVNMLKSQYLAHKVFQQEGLIGKFLKHPALDRFAGEDRDYLLQQSKLPWRFSFSVIVDEPGEDFFTMEDVFTGMKFLLYSPGVSDLMESGRPVLWFNLIGFNGYCWQSYGPIVYYRSFESSDIYFFATELNPDIEKPEEVAADVDRDPLPYMMLLLGASYPMTFHKEDQLLYLEAEHDLETLDTSGLKRDFKTEYNNGVYRISHNQWGKHPHYAQAYFDEHKELLLFSAMTGRGFMALVESFNAHGHNFPEEHYLRVNMAMVTTAGEILKRKVLLNEYHDLFHADTDPAEEKNLKDINAFIALVLPDINAGKEPDIEKAARQTGIDSETAHSVVEAVMGSLKDLPLPPKKEPAPGKSFSPGKTTASRKHPAASKELPPRTGDEAGNRLLTREDELLFDLRLYMMAGQIHWMAPWEGVYESDVFGVQIPGTERLWFVSVMGAEGEFRAISFYKGYEGFASFLEFRDQAERISRMAVSGEGALSAALLPGGPMTIPHLMLSFANREELGGEDLTAIRKSGARFRGKGHWPRIEEIVPGYLPVYPDRETLVDLFLVMQQAVIVLERAMTDDQYLYREGDPDETVLIRTPSGKGPRFRWKDRYETPEEDWAAVSYRLVYTTATWTVLSGLPESRVVLQIDLFMLPAPVKEKGKKGYFPFVLLFVDKEYNTVAGMSMMTPHPDLHSMYESIPQRVLEELVKPDSRPSKIEIRSDLLHTLLDEMLEEAGCRVAWVNQMPQMDEVIGSLIEHL